MTDESIWDKLAAIFLTPKIALVGAFGLMIAVFGSCALYTTLNGKPEIVRNENNQNVENLTENATPNPNVLPVKIIENNQNNLDIIDKENQTNIEDNSVKPQTHSNENVKKSTNKIDDVIKKSLSPTKTPVQKTDPNPILALFAGTVRSNGKNNILKLPKEAKAATLQLNLESNDYKIYSAQLTDEDGDVVYQNGKLNLSKSKINFKISAKDLKRGDYIIKLSGKNDAGENELVADFQFRVNQ